MIQPPFLQPGDTLCICAPSRKITPAELEPALQTFASWQLHVVLGQHVYSTHHQFAGTDAQRAADLQQALDSPQVRAIVLARGGYGSARLLPLLRWEGFLQHPKWIVGYSDATVWHLQLATLGVQSLHATMPINFATAALPTLQSLRQALFGQLYIYKVSPHALNAQGPAQGKLVGGNLSILYSLQGTPQAVDTEGAILFIEDINEYLYHIDRMMVNLSLSGVLAKVRGVIVGGMTDMQDNTIPYGYDAYQIVHQHVQALGVPLCFGFEAGHQPHNLALYMGAQVQLEVDAQGATLRFSDRG